MLKSNLLILVSLTIGWSTPGYASAKAATNAKIKMVDSRVDAWKGEFMSACAARVKANSEVKVNADKACSCIVKKHRDFIVGKVRSGDDIDVPGHLRELLDLYAKPAPEEVDSSDEPKMVDLDIHISADCLK